MRRRILAGGVAVVALYAAAVAATVHWRLLPVRPLFEGVAPSAPYRWVNPPPDFTNNQPPLGIKTSLRLTKRGNEGQSISTDDGQAQVIVPANVFPKRSGKKRVRISIMPDDPKVAGPAPSGLSYDGNAYRVTARYEPGGGEAKPAAQVTVLLRYPVHATDIVIKTKGATPRRLAQPHTLAATLQVFANTKQLGTFLAAAKPRAGNSARWILVGIVSAAAGVIGAVLGFMERRNRRRARSGRA